MAVYGRQAKDAHQFSAIRECVVENMGKEKERIEDAVCEQAKLAEGLRRHLAVRTAVCWRGNNYQPFASVTRGIACRAQAIIRVVIQNKTDPEETKHV